MDRKTAIEVLKELNSVIKYSGTSCVTQYSGRFNDALRLAVESLELCDNEIKKERENVIKDMQSKCYHDWGPVEWTWCCGGYRTCKICGLTEDYYERD